MASLPSPTNVSTTTNSNDEISISWDYEPTWFAFDSSDNSLGGFNEGYWYDESVEIDGFYVYRDTSSGTTTSDYSQIANTATTSYVDSGLLDGEKYFYRITTYNANGESDLSNESSSITFFPSPSSATITDVSTSSITVTWTDNSNNEDGYRVYYREYNKSTWTQFSDVSTNTTSETITGLSSGTRYEVYIQGYTEHESANSNTTQDVATTFVRNSTVYGNGSVNSTRTLSKLRNTNVYGSGGSINSLRSGVEKSRYSDLYGIGSVNTEISGFVDTVEISSHVSPIHTFVENERTSLELLDFTLTYDERERAWYTKWMGEDKITGSEDNIALISDVAPQGKEPAARITVQYSTDKRDVDDEATPVYVDSDELVREITGLPSTEDGYYRLKIDQYSGYNDITNINFGLVH